MACRSLLSIPELTQLDAALKPSVIHMGLPTFGQIAGRATTL